MQMKLLEGKGSSSWGHSSVFRVMWVLWTKNTDPKRKDKVRNTDLSPSNWLFCCSERHPSSQTVNSQTHAPLVIRLLFWAHILTVQMSLLQAWLASFSSSYEGSPLKELAACSSVGRLVPIGHRICSWLQIVFRMRNDRFTARDLKSLVLPSSLAFEGHGMHVRSV